MALPFVSSSALRSIRLDPCIQAKNLVYRPLASTVDSAPTDQETTVSAISPAAPDVATVKVASGTSAADALAAAGVSPNDAVVVRDVASGLLHDLAWVPDADVEVEPVSPRSPDGLAVLRHSTAHVLAQAVQALYPGTRLGIGPPIENGFYYDFLPSRPFTRSVVTCSFRTGGDARCALHAPDGCWTPA